MLTGRLPCGRGGRRERARDPDVSLTCSVCSGQVPQREFDLTIGKLPPVLDDRRVISLRRLIEDFAGLAAGCIDRQLEYPRRCAGYPGCQITGASGHVEPPEGDGVWTMPPIMDGRALNLGAGRGSMGLSPLITGCVTTAADPDAAADARR